MYLRHATCHAVDVSRIVGRRTRALEGQESERALPVRPSFVQPFSRYYSSKHLCAKLEKEKSDRVAWIVYSGRFLALPCFRRTRCCHLLSTPTLDVPRGSFQERDQIRDVSRRLLRTHETRRTFSPAVTSNNKDHNTTKRGTQAAFPSLLSSSTLLNRAQAQPAHERAAAVPYSSRARVAIKNYSHKQALSWPTAAQ